MKRDDMVWACGKNGAEERYVKVLAGNTEGKRKLSKSRLS
jgi:hypothetical protein